MSSQFFSWFEIPATDFLRATDFYEKVFNVKISKTKFNGVSHGIFQLKEGQTSGAIVNVEALPEKGYGPVIFFNGYGNISLILENVVDHGGTIIKKKTLIKNLMEDGSSVIPRTLIDGAVGYYAYFYDSEGNKMGLYSNS